MSDYRCPECGEPLETTISVSSPWMRQTEHLLTCYNHEDPVQSVAFERNEIQQGENRDD